MNVNNRAVQPCELTFHQWLNAVYAITKRELKEMSNSQQEQLKHEYAEYRKENQV